MKINLHHLAQTEAGPIVELTTTEHRKYSKILHGMLPKDNYGRVTPINKLGNKINRSLDEIGFIREVRKSYKNRSFRNDRTLNKQYEAFRSQYWIWRASNVK